METGTYSAGVSRRRFLGGSLVAGAGLAGAALVGCSSTGSKPAGVPTVSNPGSASAAKGPTYASIVGKNWSAREPDAIPKYGGVINGTQNNPQLPNLDPFGATQAFPHWVLSNAYSHLVHFSRTAASRNDAVFYPDLATSWETGDPTKIVFKIREGVKWHNLPPVNGRAMTAEDVKYAVLRNAQDKSSPFKATLGAIKGVETPDGSTLVINLSRFDSTVFPALADHFAWIMPKELVDAGRLKDSIVGTGPFIFQKWEQDVRVNFKKNPDYYVKGIPFVDELNLLQIMNAETRAAALQSKQLNNYTLEFKDYQQIKDDKKFVTESFLAVGATVYYMNVADPKWKDERARQAMSLVLDKDTIIKIQTEGNGIYRGVLSAQNSGWPLSQDELKSDRFYLKQNLQKAKQLMTAAGNPDGIAAPIYYDAAGNSQITGLAQYTAEVAQKAGVAKFTLIPQERAALRKNQDEQKFEGLLLGSDGEGLAELFLLDYHTGGTKNGMGLKDKDLDAKIDAVLATVDLKERQAKAKDVTRFILEHVMWKLELTDNTNWEGWTAETHNYLGTPPQQYNTNAYAYTHYV